MGKLCGKQLIVRWPPVCNTGEDSWQVFSVFCQEQPNHLTPHFKWVEEWKSDDEDYDKKDQVLLKWGESWRWKNDDYHVLKKWESGEKK